MSDVHTRPHGIGVAVGEELGPTPGARLLRRLDGVQCRHESGHEGCMQPVPRTGDLGVGGQVRQVRLLADWYAGDRAGCDVTRVEHEQGRGA
eukprot:3191556-Prymnesium_polylepis.1